MQLRWALTRPRWAHVLLVACTAFVLVVTWWPSPQHSNAPQWATAILGRTVLTGLTGLTGLTLTLVIETVQLANPGRCTTVQDVVMNTIGAAVGGGAVLLARRARRV